MSQKNPWGKDCPRIRSIHLNRWERPLRATIWTKHGIVRVEWKDVAGDRRWFSSSSGDAKREAIRAIQRIERMRESML